MDSIIFFLDRIYRIYRILIPPAAGNLKKLLTTDFSRNRTELFKSPAAENKEKLFNLFLFPRAAA